MNEFENNGFERQNDDIYKTEPSVNSGMNAQPEETTVGFAADLAADKDPYEQINEQPVYNAPAHRNIPEYAPMGAYNPHSGTYSYTKPGTVGTETNCCVWDKPVDIKVKKKGSGYKAFIAAMLTVFTVSAAAIATFMAIDTVKDIKASKEKETETAVNAQGNYSKPTSVVQVASPLSAFADRNSGLTKSEVAAICTPSAVGIVVEASSNVSLDDYGFGFFGGYGYSFPQIVQGVGSGFIYSTDGYIVTNYHVVEGATKITVHLHDGTQSAAELVGADELSDIAVIKIDANGLNLTPMKVGNSDELVVGDEVIAIGCPAGIEYMNTVTDGIISAINRDVELDDSTTSKKTMTLLQTNATINKGNSGGALINTKGEVVGINTLKLASNYEGIGFSIPINGAAPIIKQLIEHGEVVERSENDFVSSAGVIGISASAITESEAEYYDIPMGVLVTQIDRDSNAAKAGLRRGDIITAYDGTAVKSVQELNNLKANHKAGREVTVDVYRDSEDNAFKITFKLDAAK